MHAYASTSPLSLGVERSWPPPHRLRAVRSAYLHCFDNLFAGYKSHSMPFPPHTSTHTPPITLPPSKLTGFQEPPPPSLFLRRNREVSHYLPLPLPLLTTPTPAPPLPDTFPHHLQPLLHWSFSGATLSPSPPPPQTNTQNPSPQNPKGQRTYLCGASPHLSLLPPAATASEHHWSIHLPRPPREKATEVLWTFHRARSGLKRPSCVGCKGLQAVKPSELGPLL